MHNFYTFTERKTIAKFLLKINLFSKKVAFLSAILSIVSFQLYAQDFSRIIANGKINEAIDISENMAIAKVTGDNQTMSAQIFKLENEEWEKLADLTPTQKDFEVRAVAIEGKWAVVAGLTSLFVYEFNGETWQKNAELTGTNTIWSHEYGKSIAIDKNQMVVGAPAENAKGASSGAVYLYKYLDGKWLQTGKLTASDADAYFHFGSAVAIEDDIAVVGSADHHAAYIFEYDAQNESWNEATRLYGYKGDFSYFGQSVAIENKRIFIGEPGTDALGKTNDLINGSVHVFESNANHWAKTTTIASPKGKDLTTLKENLGTEGDYFGTSLDVKDNKMVIGADRDNKVYVFEYDGFYWNNTNELSVAAELDTTTYVFGNQLGSKVAISGNNVIAASTYGAVAYAFPLELPVVENTEAVIPSREQEITVNIFPNPVAEELKINLKEAVQGEVQMQLLDQLGRVIYRKKVNVSDSKEIVDLNLQDKGHLEPGTMFLNIQAANGLNKTVRLVKR